MIELKGVNKAFEGLPVLEDIDLRIEDGEKLCIIGKSGIGKSVTLKLMTGLLRADSGRIMIDGEDVTGHNQKDWNRVMKNFGVVFQGAALFDSLSILQNVGIRLFEERQIPEKEIKERVSNALEQVGLNPGEVLKKFPAELSGGMRKRVGIARAIVHEPAVLFYDEPTTGLDPISSDLIDELIESISRKPGRTSIIITHDIFTITEIASKVAMVHDRKLHFHGTPAELFASEDEVVRAFLKRSGYG